MKPRPKKLTTPSKADVLSSGSHSKAKKPKKRADKPETELRPSMNRPNLRSISDPQRRFSSVQRTTKKSTDSISQERYSISKNLFSLRLMNAFMKASQRNYILWNEEEEDSTSSSSESSNESEVPEAEVPMGIELPKDLEGSEVREYIENTVGEPLLLAMATVERERPDNPIEFIAEYLLHFKVQAEEEKARIDKEIRKLEANPVDEQQMNVLNAFTQLIREDRL